MTMLALLFAATSAAQAGAPPPELEAALRAKYPEVARWQIDALDAERVAHEAGAPVLVVRLGARSAVVGAEGRLLWFAVRGFRDVLVAARSFAARTDAAVDDVALEERDVLGMTCTPLVDVDAVTGTWTRRGIREGDVLCSDSLEPKPPVVRGSEVAVVYSAPRVRVVATARAEQDAKLGERLPVRNLSSGELYYAVASGANEVTAHE